MVWNLLRKPAQVFQIKERSPHGKDVRMFFGGDHMAKMSKCFLVVISNRSLTFLLVMKDSVQLKSVKDLIYSVMIND